MSLPYENATSGGAALDDIRKILLRLGCTRFGTMNDHEHGELLVQFSHRGRDVQVAASFHGYAAAWLREHPWTTRKRGTRSGYEKRARQQAEISACSILRDWLKGQITAVETGILSFEGAFLGQLLLPETGRTVLATLQAEKALPQPENSN